MPFFQRSQDLLSIHALPSLCSWRELPPVEGVCPSLGTRALLFLGIYHVLFQVPFTCPGGWEEYIIVPLEVPPYVGHFSHSPGNAGIFFASREPFPAIHFQGFVISIPQSGDQKDEATAAPSVSSLCTLGWSDGVLMAQERRGASAQLKSSFLFLRACIF